jgi:hypothetical protein
MRLVVALVLVLVLVLVLDPRTASADRLWCGTPWRDSPRPTRALGPPPSSESRHVEIRGVHDVRLARALRHAALACTVSSPLHVHIAITSDGVAYAPAQPCLDARLRAWRLPPSPTPSVVDAIVAIPAT